MVVGLVAPRNVSRVTLENYWTEAPPVRTRIGGRPDRAIAWRRLSCSRRETSLQRGEREEKAEWAPPGVLYVV